MGCWIEEPSLDGKGEFHLIRAEPMGSEPRLAPPDLRGHAQKEQILMADSVMGMVTDKIKGVMSGISSNDH